MNTIQVRATHVSSEQAYTDIRIADNNNTEIPPETAVTIASWWQAPSGTGYVLAGFASGAEVDRAALLDDIAATRNAHGYHDSSLGMRDRMDARDRDALDFLSTFVINYEKES